MDGELTVRYYALFHAVYDSLFLDDEGGGETALLAGLKIRSHPFDIYERKSKVASALTHLSLPMRMAGGFEDALGLGGRVAGDQGAEDGELATADATSPSNASVEPSMPTPLSPTITSNQLLPATLQRVLHPAYAPINLALLQ